jgi:hypothetical protein
LSRLPDVVPDRRCVLALVAAPASWSRARRRRPYPCVLSCCGACVVVLCCDKKQKRRRPRRELSSARAPPKAETPERGKASEKRWTW